MHILILLIRILFIIILAFFANQLRLKSTFFQFFFLLLALQNLNSFRTHIPTMIKSFKYIILFTTLPLLLLGLVLRRNLLSFIKIFILRKRFLASINLGFKGTLALQISSFFIILCRILPLFLSKTRLSVQFFMYIIILRLLMLILIFLRRSGRRITTFASRQVLNRRKLIILIRLKGASIKISLLFLKPKLLIIFVI